MDSIRVGTRLWYAPDYGRPGRGWVVVVKTGRKWLHLSREVHDKHASYDGNCMRADAVSLRVPNDGMSFSGQCYCSKEEFEKALALEAAWGRLRKLVAFTSRPPQGLTVEGVEDAVRDLQLDEKTGRKQLGH